MEPFVEPFNWCDYACEVCPLAGECRLNMQNEQRRWVYRARGIDPDDPEVAAADFEQAISHAYDMVREIALEEGIDPDAPLPPPELPPPIALRLEEASRDYVKSVVRAVRDADPDADGAPEAIEMVRNRSHVVVGKVARLRNFIAPGGELRDDDVLWDRSAVPVLLLIERADAAVAAAMSKLVLRERPEPAAWKLSLVPEEGEDGGLEAVETPDSEPDNEPSFEKARAELLRALRPLFDCVDDELRQELDRLVREGRAPSPFVRVEPRDPDLEESLLV